MLAESPSPWGDGDWGAPPPHCESVWAEELRAPLLCPPTSPLCSHCSEAALSRRWERMVPCSALRGLCAQPPLLTFVVFSLGFFFFFWFLGFFSVFFFFFCCCCCLNCYLDRKLRGGGLCRAGCAERISRDLHALHCCVSPAGPEPPAGRRRRKRRNCSTWTEGLWKRDLTSTAFTARKPQPVGVVAPPGRGAVCLGAARPSFVFPRSF